MDACESAPLDGALPANRLVRSHMVVCAFSFSTALLGFGRFFGGISTVSSMQDANGVKKECTDSCHLKDNAFVLMAMGVFGVVIFAVSIAWLAPCTWRKSYSALDTYSGVTQNLQCIGFADVAMLAVGIFFAVAQVTELVDWDWYWEGMVETCDRCLPCPTNTVVEDNSCGFCKLEDCMDVKDENKTLKGFLMGCTVITVLLNILALGACAMGCRVVQEAQRIKRDLYSQETPATLVGARASGIRASGLPVVGAPVYDREGGSRASGVRASGVRASGVYAGTLARASVAPGVAPPVVGARLSDRYAGTLARASLSGVPGVAPPTHEGTRASGVQASGPRASGLPRVSEKYVGAPNSNRNVAPDMDTE